MLAIWDNYTNLLNNGCFIKSTRIKLIKIKAILYICGDILGSVYSRGFGDLVPTGSVVVEILHRITLLLTLEGKWEDLTSVWTCSQVTAGIFVQLGPQWNQQKLVVVPQASLPLLLKQPLPSPSHLDGIGTKDKFCWRRVRMRRYLGPRLSHVWSGEWICTISSTLTPLYCFKTSGSNIIYIVATAQLKCDISHLPLFSMIPQPFKSLSFAPHSIYNSVVTWFHPRNLL